MEILFNRRRMFIGSGIAGGVLGSLAGKLFKCCNSAEAEAPLEGAAHLAEAVPVPRIVAWLSKIRKYISWNRLTYKRKFRIFIQYMISS